jgi:PIN domain nuclease of toxin-antitoxin system
VIYLDTHIIVWLYVGDLTKLSPNAREIINQNDLMISPMVCLELQYLKEIGRLTIDGQKITDYLVEAIQLKICDISFRDIITEANKLSWTRDPFDRLIVAHAITANCNLLTKDERIRNNFACAVW